MSNYRITELDFDNIKTNLKQFLSNYRDDNNDLVFSDYDFDASGLSVLLDLLAYNTHYNAYLANMVANEMFLDSAVKRQSAVSLAKHLGYTPTSVRSARAKISFTVKDVPNSPGSLTLGRYTPFTTEINGKSYTFLNLDSIIIKPQGQDYVFNDVEIVEGEYLTYSYRVELAGPSQKYSIPNKNIDTTTIKVTVRNSLQDTTTATYTLANDFASLNSQSQVYFLQENASGFYEIYFGSGSIGKSPIPGNIVLIEYLVSNGSICNVSSNIDQYFTIGSSVGGGTIDTAILATTNASGGEFEDSIEEIKFKAPRFLSSYNRAVTADDYKALIESNYPLVESVSVWGGETNDPPKYGKVMVSLKPYMGYTINAETKSRIESDILGDRKMLTTIPEFVDPDYLYVSINCTAKFNPNGTNKTTTDLQSGISNTIQKYFALDLQKFNKSFVYSKLSNLIDKTDTSIIGNSSVITLQKRIVIPTNLQIGYFIKFANSLASGTLKSTAFEYLSNGSVLTVYMQDELTKNSDGKVSLYDFYTNALVYQNIGSINYKSGLLTIPKINVFGYLQNATDIRISAKPTEFDINSSRDTILILDDTKNDTASGRTSGLTILVLESA
jgi:hypothetical protein